MNMTSLPITIGNFQSNFDSDTIASIYGAYVVLDPDDKYIYLWESHFSGDASTPMQVVHKAHLVLGEVVRGGSLDVAVDFLSKTETQELLDELCAGWDTKWNGHNRVGVLTFEAEHALETIEANWESDVEDAAPKYTTCGVFDWFTGLTSDNALLVELAQDRGVEGAADDLVAEARSEGVILDKESVESYVRELAQRRLEHELG